MEIFDTLGIFFTKKGSIDESWSSFMVNRFLSMDEKYRKIAFLANNYYISDDIKSGIYWFFLPKLSKAPWIRYVKSKKEKESEFAEIFSLLQKYYEWSDAELEMYIPYYLELFQTEDNIIKHKEFLGIENNI